MSRSFSLFVVTALSGEPAKAVTTNRDVASAAIRNLNVSLISPTVKTAGWYGKPVKTG